MQNMQRLFQSTTLKLTTVYLAGTILLSVGFSILIYNTASSELDARFEVLKARLETTQVLPSNFDFDSIRERQVEEARQNIIAVLFYTNLIILTLGGIASYLLARRMLRPIENMHEAQVRFTSDASHELRTPLAVMKTELEVALRDKDISKKELTELAKSNLEEVDRLSKLANILLKLARLEDLLLDTESFDITKSIRYAIKTLSIAPERVIVNGGGKPLYIQANKESITELVMILLDNANKYSPSDTPIEIQVKKRTGRIILAIKNQGDGIKPEDLKLIFSRFYRSDASRKRTTTSGYGLGLAIAKKIVEIHHGELTASSALNQPTTLTVKLPAKQ